MDDIRRQRVISRVERELEVTETLLAYLQRSLLEARAGQDVDHVRRRITRAADLVTHLRSKRLKALDSEPQATNAER